jgi:hypothetical protein
MVFNSKRGEIATIITLGTLLILGISTLVSSAFLNKNTPQTTKTKAAVTCGDNPEGAYPGFRWKADCSLKGQCVTKDTCPENPDKNVNKDPKETKWCYGFAGPAGNSSDWRCMMLVYEGQSTQPTAAPVGTTGSTTTSGGSKDGELCRYSEIHDGQTKCYVGKTSGGTCKYDPAVFKDTDCSGTFNPSSTGGTTGTTNQTFACGGLNADGKKNTVGQVDCACCTPGNTNNCPSGQSCVIANGGCQGGFSCGVATDSGDDSSAGSEAGAATTAPVPTGTSGTANSCKFSNATGTFNIANNTSRCIPFEYKNLITCSNGAIKDNLNCVYGCEGKDRCTTYEEASQKTGTTGTTGTNTNTSGNCIYTNSTGTFTVLNGTSRCIPFDYKTLITCKDAKWKDYSCSLGCEGKTACNNIVDTVTGNTGTKVTDYSSCMSAYDNDAAYCNSVYPTQTGTSGSTTGSSGTGTDVSMPNPTNTPGPTPTPVLVSQTGAIMNNGTIIIENVSTEEINELALLVNDSLIMNNVKLSAGHHQLIDFGAQCWPWERAVNAKKAVFISYKKSGDVPLVKSLKIGCADQQIITLE